MEVPLCPHLLRAHVELGADLARVPGEQRCRRQGAGLVLVLLLVHGRHQAEVPHLHHVVHGEEDVGGLQAETETGYVMRRQQRLLT